jgi:hypothetical protein
MPRLILGPIDKVAIFSKEEKKAVAAAVEQALLALGNPELPKKMPRFILKVRQKDRWSWDSIKSNWQAENDYSIDWSGTSTHHEEA